MLLFPQFSARSLEGSVFKSVTSCVISVIARADPNLWVSKMRLRISKK